MNVVELNQNISNCVKSAKDFTVTHYTNVCNGETYDVDMGLFDTILVYFLLGLVAGVILLLFSLTFKIIFDRWW